MEDRTRTTSGGQQQPQQQQQKQPPQPTDASSRPAAGGSLSGGGSNNGPRTSSSASNRSSSPRGDLITLFVHPTTGGQFELQICSGDSVELLKKIISKRLKVTKERLCLLHKDRHLKCGTIQQNGLVDGSKVTLLPNVETGLVTQRPEQSVLQALENLSDSQVNDFLTGKAPLNLTMRLGDHMMFIQLQLSTVGTSASTSGGSSTSSIISSGPSHKCTLSTSHPLPTSPQPSSPSSPIIPSSPSLLSTSSPLFIQHRHHHHHHSTHRLPSILPIAFSQPVFGPSSPSSSSSSPSSSSAAVSSSTASSESAAPPVSSSPVVTPPASSPLFTKSGASCPHGRPVYSNSSSSSGSNSSTGRLTDVTHLLDSRTLAEASRNLSHTLRQLSTQALDSRVVSSSSTSSTSSPAAVSTLTSSSVPSTSSCDPRTKERGSTAITTTSSGSRRPGAIIESIRNHGRGVFSGTFSGSLGTLNPALQDRNGRPKRDIGTIIHILNDLLGAAPQYRRSTSGSELTSLNIHSSSSSSSTTRGILHHPNLSRSIEFATARSKSDEEYKRLKLENSATRDKMEQLQLRLEERRARRKARREARAPYATWVRPESDITAVQQGILGNSSAANSANPNPLADHEMVDYMQLNTETVVA